MAQAPAREGMVRGTLIVALSTLLVRGMAALYKPFMIRLFGPFDGNSGQLGFGLTQSPATAYLIVLSFTSIGFNVAIGKLVAQRVALGDRAGARRVFRISLLLMAGLGALASVLFVAGAPWLERVTNMSGTAYGYIAMAPALLVISLVAAYRGLFQGFQFMQPNATSQMIEASVRILAALVLVFLLVPRSVVLAAGASNLGDSVGGVAALIYLLYLYRRARRALWQDGDGAAAPGSAPDLRATIGQLLRLALPIALIGAAPPLMTYVDLFIIGRGISTTATGVLYGQLNTGITIVWLPTVLAGALYNSLVPSVSEAMAIRDAERIRRLAATAYRAVLLVAWPATAGLLVLATPVYRLVADTVAGSGLLVILALSVLPNMLQLVTSGILQGMGRTRPPVLSLLAGTGLKIALTLWLVPHYRGAGAAWATVAGFSLTALLNLIAVSRITGVGLDWVGTVVKPAAASALMVLVVWGLKLPLAPYLAGGFRLLAATLLLVGVGVAAYAGALLLVRGLPRQDLERVPRIGPAVARRLARARLLAGN